MATHDRDALWSTACSGPRRRRFVPGALSPRRSLYSTGCLWTIELEERTFSPHRGPVQTERARIAASREIGGRGRQDARTTGRQVLCLHAGITRSFQTSTPDDPRHSWHLPPLFFLPGGLENINLLQHTGGLYIIY